YDKTCATLTQEATLSPDIQICDNIDLDVIFKEYDGYYKTKFNKYPMLCKKVAKNANTTEYKTKVRSTGKQTKTEQVKEKNAQQQMDDDPVNDFNHSLTITPIFAHEHRDGSLSQNSIPKEQSMQSKISKCIEKLYSANSELRKIAEDVSNEIVLNNLNVHWDDVIGLEQCKNAVKEAIVYPLKYPIFFAKLFSPWKGILLYGPPGTGKTMLAKAVATECNCTFFNITASSLVSKWRGDSEKYIRVLFDLAYSHSPTIIFIDEIDWIATVENNLLSEPAKRFRSELLTRMDGLVSTENSNVVLLAATNSPWNIDAALLRRLEKRIYVSLPDEITRLHMFRLYLSDEMLEDQNEINMILEMTKSYSSADIKLLCKQAWMTQISPICKQLDQKEISITHLIYKLKDFEVLKQLIGQISPTVTNINKYTQWDNHKTNK
ncbi:Katanin p60 ATPase-containing subunit A-like 2, partial [Eufriesea mexicana]